MTRPPDLFDTAAVRRNAARAARAPVRVLRDAVRAEVQERLIEVNRTFTAPAVVTLWPADWADVLPGAVIVAPDDRLALGRGAHDLVVHDLCLHWANDPVGQLVQARLALVPDGLFLGTLFGGQTLVELRAALTEAEAQVRGGLSPRIAPMGEIRDLGGLLQRAGLALPVADATPFDLRYRDVLSLMHDLRGMGEANAMADRPRGLTPRALFAAAQAIYAARHGDSEGRLRATFEVVTLTGWAPADSQPKPLRPGSATHRLEDALRAALDGPAGPLGAIDD